MILAQDEMVLVSKADISMVIDPVFRPNFIKNTWDFKTVILDPVSGVRSNVGYQSHAKGGEASLKIAKRAKLALEAKGYKVMLTRENAKSISCDKRAKMINAVKEHAVVVMIGFAKGEKDEQGIRTFVSDPTTPEATRSQISAYAPSVGLAASIHGVAVNKFRNSTVDGGVSRLRDFFMSQVKHPVILLEGGFVTHALEARLIDNEAYSTALVESIVDGVRKYHFATVPPGPLRAFNSPK